MRGAVGASEDLILERSTGGSPVTNLAGVNEAMAEVGTRLWPLDLRGAPSEIRRLFAQASLDRHEAERLKAHFLLPRERLLALIEAAGRTPHVAGGGELSTYVASHDYRYPQLWTVEAGVDYTRFDRFHVNRSEDGTGVDEVLQMVWGRGLEIVRRKPDGEILTLTASGRRCIVGALALSGLLVLLACDPRSFSTPPSASCASDGEQCALAEGPLGVCERSRCASGESPPCFTCTPQH